MWIVTETVLHENMTNTQIQQGVGKSLESITFVEFLPTANPILLLFVFRISSNGYVICTISYN